MTESNPAEFLEELVSSASGLFCKGRDQGPSTRETLPAELRHQILSVSDIKNLKALVFASPIFHQQYLLDRKTLLRRALKSALGSALADVYAVQHMSASLYEPGHAVQQKTLGLFMDNYVTPHSASPDQLLAEVTTEEDLAAIAGFYSCLARLLLEQCAAIFLRRLDASLRVGNLSGTERTRLLRALYCFQLCCNLLGVGPQGCRPPLRLPSLEHP
ncbi:hypothetical protein VTI74DRAFT_9125 [Chaetomium olivicolor]